LTPSCLRWHQKTQTTNGRDAERENSHTDGGDRCGSRRAPSGSVLCRSATHRRARCRDGVDLLAYRMACHRLGRRVHSRDRHLAQAAKKPRCDTDLIRRVQLTGRLDCGSRVFSGLLSEIRYRGRRAPCWHAKRRGDLFAAPPSATALRRRHALANVTPAVVIGLFSAAAARRAAIPIGVPICRHSCRGRYVAAYADLVMQTWARAPYFLKAFEELGPTNHCLLGLRGHPRFPLLSGSQRQRPPALLRSKFTKARRGSRLGIIGQV
jgi:hypothetical protein